MLNPAHVPPVGPDEILARFILASSHVRKPDGTVKPDAFMPHPRIELSMTRHLEASDDEIWREGRRVAALRKKNLHGRADVSATAFTGEALCVEARPIPENPNHADAINWPADKAAQKMKAVEISIKSQYTPAPNGPGAAS